VKVAVGEIVGVKVGAEVSVTVGVRVGKPPPSALATGGIKIPFARRKTNPININDLIRLFN